jgi:hypothetical protein
MKRPVEIKLSYDSIIGILQGKELHIRTMDNEFIFYPPFDGVFVTHGQLAEMRANDTMGVLNFLHSLGKYTEDAETK